MIVRSERVCANVHEARMAVVYFRPPVWRGATRGEACVGKRLIESSAARIGSDLGRRPGSDACPVFDMSTESFPLMMYDYL